MHSHPPSFYIYDFETFGTHPALDRPAQFAGVRVDHKFNIIEEPLILYCKQSDDYLPTPEAVLITGITPQKCNANGVQEVHFAEKISEVFKTPNSCILGFNSIKFDDEVTRHLFYRNFIDPYSHHYANGNSRWDIIDVVRATYALRPDGINWPLNEDGLPIFKLEALTKANNIEHQNAHDAMSDVYATIEIMKLISNKQPRLFQYLYQHRDKQKLLALIDIVDIAPLVHVSSYYGAAKANLSMIAPLAWHPTNKNALICFDLTADISSLKNLSISQLSEALYKPRHLYSDGQLPIGLQLVYLNKCPILAPEKTLLPDNITRLNLDIDHINSNLKQLREASSLREKAYAVYEQSQSYTATESSAQDVDNQLYTRFFSQSDKYLFERIRTTEPRNLPLIEINSEDPRISELFFRFKARNYPATLDIEEQQAWLEYRKSRLNEETVISYMQKLDELALLHAGDNKKLNLLKQLLNYLQVIAY